MKPFLSVLFLLAILFSSPVFSQDDEIVIGLVAPLTGDQAYIGVG